MIIGLFVYVFILNINLSNKNVDIEKMKSQKEKDNTQIISLQRENIDLKSDTARYRQGIRDFRIDLEKVKKIDKNLAKDLSSNFPTIEQLKNNPPRR